MSSPAERSPSALSHHERRRLEAIERHLQREDPDLARRLAEQPPPPRPGRGVSRALLFLGVLGVLIGLLTINGVVLVMGGLLPICAWLWLRHRNSHNDPESRP